MGIGSDYCITPGLGLLLHDAGISLRNVLVRAGLPHDLIARGPVRLSSDDYFGLWQGIEEEAADPLLPIRLGRAFSVQAFDPLIFAASCSRNFEIAAERIALFKRLVGPMRLVVQRADGETTLEFEWPPGIVPPTSLAITELVFVVALIRAATRVHVQPIRAAVTSTHCFEPEFHDYFGISLESGSVHSITIAEADAKRPFLTVNEGMWATFEPQLRTRLADLARHSITSDRVRAALLELLPAGDSSIGTVARTMAMSPRSMQRQLRSEGTTFQELLGEIREQLAHHYLGRTDLTTSDIAFLLGYEDPRSFLRAFSARLGETPGEFRRRTAVASS